MQQKKGRLIMETDYAWGAGIIDGEGYVSFQYDSKKKIRPIIEVYNTDYRILAELKRLFNGYIVESIRNNRPNNKTCWIWRIRGKKAIICLRQICKYLISKKQEAEILIEFEPLIGKTDKRNEKEHLWEKLKILKANK